MPTYQYRCTECDHDLEVVQKFSDAALSECPNCHGRLRKIFNAVGVVFKGSGFYRTDSRAKEGSGAAGNGSEKGEAAAKADVKDGGKADGKDGGNKSDTAAKTPAQTAGPSGSRSAGSGENGSTSSSSTGTKSSTGSPSRR